MDDPAGPSKRLRKTTSRERMLTTDDLNHIMNWSSDEDVDSGSSWSGGNGEYGDSTDDQEETPELAEPNVVFQQTQNIQKGSDIWHEDKYTAQPIPFTGTTGLIVSPVEIFLSENITDKSRVTKWKILTVAEFKVFLGLLYHMGTIRTNRLQDYWKRGYLFDLSCFNSRMSRDRWMLILRCLHFAKNPAQGGEPQPRDRLYKINPLLDIFHENIDRIQYPTRVLAIDESMVLWRGRLVFRQFIHGKRHKYGIKMYVLTDSLGFVLKCIIYSGSNDTEVGGKGHVTNVVKKILEGKLGVGHTIYMDNYYNSVELAQYLLNNKTYCTGTLREMIQRFTQEGTCIMKWRDRRDVLVISTEYDGTLVEEINKKGNQITKPKAILQYNKFMGGIDHSDQMLSYYSCEHKTMRWYKKLGIHILQIILVNSQNLFNRYSGSKLNLYEFRLSVIETLIKEGLETTLAPRFTPQPKIGNHYPKMFVDAKSVLKPKNVQKLTSTAQHAQTIAADKSKPELSNFFQQTRDVTAKACGISLACVKKVCSEAKKELEVGPSNKIAFKSPRKSYKRVKVMSSLDDFDNEVVRRTIHSFYDKGEFPTTAKILVAMQEKINYPGSKTSVKRILHNLNFKYKTCNDERKFLMERNDIVACRVKFLRKMYELRQNNLEEPSVVVMDNASYHSVLAEEYPRANARKADIQKWLEKKSISYSPVETLCELREKVKMAIPREKKYKLDSVALQMGHEVVRLPPYHCQYNPIELIWAQVKGEVAKKNSIFKMADVEVLVNNALDEITKEVWTKCGEHCNKLQDADFIKEGLRDEILEPIILIINPDDSSTDEDENDDDKLPY
ncbi:hypothetical protein QTP88_010038 [Uroleucon formosanum]